MNRPKSRIINEPFSWKAEIVGIIAVIIAGIIILPGCAHIRREQREKDAAYVDFRLSSFKWQILTMTNNSRVVPAFDEFRKKLSQELRDFK